MRGGRGTTWQLRSPETRERCDNNDHADGGELIGRRRENEYKLKAFFAKDIIVELSPTGRS